MKCDCGKINAIQLEHPELGLEIINKKQWKNVDWENKNNCIGE